MFGVQKSKTHHDDFLVQFQIGDVFDLKFNAHLHFHTKPKFYSDIETFFHKNKFSRNRFFHQQTFIAFTKQLPNQTNYDRTYIFVTRY
jgi:hypothetical protein